MQTFFKLSLTASAVLLCSSIAIAANGNQDKSSSHSALLMSSPWSFEFGPRYWLSSGKYTETLYGNDNELLSRLTYSDLTANAAEGFWQLVHQNGVFLKGYIGGGSIENGHLNDEDFPPVIEVYSNTLEEQKNGALNYLSVDLGYRFFQTSNIKLGGFVGYHYWSENYHTFGCQQTAGGAPNCAEPLLTTVDSLDNAAYWNSLRLGVNGQIALSPSVNAIADFAYIKSNLTALDYHNLRSDIRGTLGEGSGDGFQLDALLNWSVTPNLNVGAGARWWQVKTKGSDHYEQTAAGGLAQPSHVSLKRYGLLLQSNYRFDELQPLDKFSSKDSQSLSYPWTGAFLGFNLGYGANSTKAVFSAATPAAAMAQSGGFSPNLLNVADKGFLAGVQAGYDWKRERVVFGIEGDVDYAHISSANAVTMGDTEENEVLTTTVTKNMRSLGTLRARIGKLASEDMMVFITAGPAWGKTQLSFDQREPFGACEDEELCIAANNSKVKWGWAAGGGIEYAVTHRATFKAEYLYAALGSQTLNATVNTGMGLVVYQVQSNFNNNLVRMGVNYKI